VAIQLEFVNLIVPIQTIEDRYPGGWKAYLDDNEKRIGKVMWFDNSLVRASGCMCGDEVDGLITKYTRLGFTSTETLGVGIFWKNFCIVDAFGISRHSCNWLEFDPISRSAFLAGTVPGKAIGR
jgi:hypothetical protein